MCLNKSYHSLLLCSSVSSLTAHGRGVAWLPRRVDGIAPGFSSLGKRRTDGVLAWTDQKHGTRLD